MRPLTALVLVWATLSHAGFAEAEARLSWRSPEGCPSQAEVLAMVHEAHPEGPPPWARFAAIEGRLTLGEGSAAAAYQLLLTLREPGGTRQVRRLSADSCVTLSRAGAVAIALALSPDPTRNEEPASAAPGSGRRGGRGAPSTATAVEDLQRLPPRTQQQPTPSQPPTASSAGHDETPGKAPPAAPPRWPLHWQFGLEAVRDGQSLTESSWGVRARVGARLPRAGGLGFSLQALRLSGQGESLSPTARVQFDLLALGARSCIPVGAGVLTTRVCGEVEMGRLTGRSSGLSQPAQPAHTWLATGPALVLGWPVSQHWSVEAGAVALWLLRGAEFTVNEVDRVHRLPATALRGHVGVAWTLL